MEKIDNQSWAIWKNGAKIAKTLGEEKVWSFWRVRGLGIVKEPAEAQRKIKGIKTKRRGEKG